MKVLAQRGDDFFLVDTEDKEFYVIDTNRRKKWKVDSPDEVYRAGYWVNPEPTGVQVKTIVEMLAGGDTK